MTNDWSTVVEISNSSCVFMFYYSKLAYKHVSVATISSRLH